MSTNNNVTQPNNQKKPQQNNNQQNQVKKNFQNPTVVQQEEKKVVEPVEETVILASSTKLVADPIETLTEVVEEKKPTVTVETKATPLQKPVEIPKHVKTPVEELKVGMQVKISTSAKTTAVGLPIPEFAYRNMYKVVKILPSRVVLISVGGIYKIAVTKNDIEVI